jgi:hypothetical protein
MEAPDPTPAGRGPSFLEQVSTIHIFPTAELDRGERRVLAFK